MQLTLYSDYSLRVLIYLSRTPNELTTITQIAEFYNISRNHLVKVVHKLAQLGFILSTRGKNGGIKLAYPANEIFIGDVVRKTEPSFCLVECFNEKTNRCAITGICRLKGILSEGLQAFLNVLDQYTLEEASTEKVIFMINQSLKFGAK